MAEPNYTSEAASLPSQRRSVRDVVMDLGSIRKSYARYAPIYDHTFKWFLGHQARLLAASVANRTAGSLLEVGVGTGLSLPHYRRDHEISGIDISPEMLARARKRVAERKLTNVQLLALMDAEELAFDNDSFDVVVAAYVMSVVPNPSKVIREIERVCRPGGRVIILNHFAVETGLRSAIERKMAPLSRKLGWRPDFDLGQMMAATGLKLLEEPRDLAPLGLFTLLHLGKPSTDAAA